MRDHTVIIDDPLEMNPQPEEIHAARNLLMKCSPELTTPYKDRRKPRVITLPQLNTIKRIVRHVR